jgi:4-hydroxyphenylpyruvate dioxygenase
MELFSRTMSDPSPSVPNEHARRGMEAWKKLVHAMSWLR